MRLPLHLLGALGLAAFAMGAVAADPAEARRKPKPVVAKTAQAFKAADANADRQLDLPEWAAAGLPEAAFPKVDRNGNGTVGFHESLMATLAMLKAKGPR